MSLASPGGQLASTRLGSVALERIHAIQPIWRPRPTRPRGSPSARAWATKLDVTLSQSLVESNEQTWIVDYLPVRRIALRFVQDDEELKSYEFRHDVTFGNAPNAIRSGDASREVKQPRVSAVRVMGDLRFPETQVRGVLRLNEGDRFDFIDWQEDRDRLERFYQRQQHWAARITTNRAESDAGVELTYTIDAGPETRIRVMGVSLRRSVLEEIQTAWTRSVFEGFLIEEAEGIVRRELALQATYQPMLEVKVEGDEAVRTLVIDVTPTPRADRIEVRFDGVDDKLKKELVDRAGDRTQAVQALTSSDGIRAHGPRRAALAGISAGDGERRRPDVRGDVGDGSGDRERRHAIPHRRRDLRACERRQGGGSAG